jgi:GNAT superfamily N-acetyltransferase
VIVLWHANEPIGICVYATPAASLTLRSKYFRLTNPRNRVAMSALNEQLWLLQRVVIHPTYRGAGIAAEFVRRACELCDVDWIETLSAMGQTNPFFEKAGFVRVGVIPKTRRAGDVSPPRNRKNGAYGGKRKPPAPDTHPFSEPVYYVFDNRHRPRK